VARPRPESYQSRLVRSVYENNVADLVNVLEMSSDEAFQQLRGTDAGPFDLIHIDGSHSEAQSLRDVRMWPDLLRPGGVLVMDDIQWPTVQAALDYLRSHFAVIEEIIETDGVAYGAYRHRDSALPSN
jgi:predicted O-methyltransferase YrrM